MENLLSLLVSLGDRVVGLLPGWVLRRSFPIPKLAKRVAIFAVGTGPYIYTKAGKPLRFTNLNLVVFNPLPFPVEVRGLKLRVDLGDTYLLTIESHDRMTIAKRGYERLDLDYDLSDNQAVMIQRPTTPCLNLHVSGPVHFHSRVRDFTVHMAANTLGFRVPDQS